jgi:hypothetical protein
MSPKLSLPFAALLPVFTLVSQGATLQSKTIKAWDDYVTAAKANLIKRVTEKRPVLCGTESAGLHERLRSGEVLVAPTVDKTPFGVPGGLIHDWTGAAFIPGARINDVLSVLDSYDKYDEIYRPAVVKAKLLQHSGSEYRFSLLLLRKVLHVTAAMEGEYESRYFQVDKTHWYSVLSSVRVQEIEDYGKPTEHKLPPDRGSGYVWRACSLTRYEERDGGVYSEVQLIGLSREIPVSFRWIVNPVVNRLSRNSLSTSLQQTRDAVGQARQSATGVRQSVATAR